MCIFVIREAEGAVGVLYFGEKMGRPDSQNVLSGMSVTNKVSHEAWCDDLPSREMNCHTETKKWLDPRMKLACLRLIPERGGKRLLVFSVYDDREDNLYVEEALPLVLRAAHLEEQFN